MPVMFPRQDVHLLGKILDQADPEWLSSNGFTAGEIARVDTLHLELDPILTELIGDDWDDREALV